jgi:hypothetical protein
MWKKTSSGIRDAVADKYLNKKCLNNIKREKKNRHEESKCRKSSIVRAPYYYVCFYYCGRNKRSS